MFLRITLLAQELLEDVFEAHLAPTFRLANQEANGAMRFVFGKPVAELFEATNGTSSVVDARCRSGHELIHATRNQAREIPQARFPCQVHEPAKPHHGG
jgi:hypothetical protein